MATKRIRRATLSEGAMIQRRYIERFLQRARPRAADYGLNYTLASRDAFNDGVEWLKAKTYRFLATEPKRTRLPGGLGRTKRKVA